MSDVRRAHAVKEYGQVMQCSQLTGKVLKFNVAMEKATKITWNWNISLFFFLGKSLYTVTAFWLIEVISTNIQCCLGCIWFLSVVSFWVVKEKVQINQYGTDSAWRLLPQLKQDISQKFYPKTVTFMLQLLNLHSVELAQLVYGWMSVELCRHQLCGSRYSIVFRATGVPLHCSTLCIQTFETGLEPDGFRLKLDDEIVSTGIWETNTDFTRHTDLALWLWSMYKFYTILGAHCKLKKVSKSGFKMNLLYFMIHQATGSLA